MIAVLNLAVLNNKHLLSPSFTGQEVGSISWGVLAQASHTVAIKPLAEAAVTSEDPTGLLSSITCLLAGPWILAGCWLEISVPHHMGLSQQISRLPSKQVRRERKKENPIQKSQSFLVI